MTKSNIKNTLSIYSILDLLRIYQWTKNLFMFLPLFFGGKLFDVEILSNLLPGFFAFGCVASAIYVVNDYRDSEDDKKHPQKKLRPIASGAISSTTALTIAAIIFSMGLFTSYLLDIRFFLVLLFYFFMNIAYTFKLKQIPIIDVSIIATGFLLRLISGGILVDIVISKWLLIMTFLLALFMGFAKRRDDVLILNNTGQFMRTSVKGYNIEFINASMILMAGIVVVAYLMYTVSEEVVSRFNNDYLFITALPVIIGVLRYLQLTMVMNNSANPSKLLLKDRFLQIVILIWTLLFYAIIYVKEFKELLIGLI